MRRREPVRRPLNVPRHYFSRRGLDGYHRLAPRERVERLRTLTRAVVPGRARSGTSRSSARLARGGSAWSSP